MENTEESQVVVMVAAADCVWLLLWMLDSVISFVKFPVM
jgi:hypothetical protein